MSQAPYEIIEQIGEGGMCLVYKAQMRPSGQIVALKVLKEELASSAIQCKRFIREAKVCISLRYPSIMQAFSVGQHDGKPCMVLEYIEGQSLRERLDSGLHLIEGLEMLMSVIDALSFAHNRGITHRDLKPANVMITRGGSVKVADWGLARLTDEATVLTKTGMLLGTPAYMAPEQIKGGDITHKVDLYALGVMLFELTTGRLPYKANNAAELLSSHLNAKVPSIKEHHHTAHPALAKITKRMMAKAPEERPDALEVGKTIGLVVRELREKNKSEDIATTVGRDNESPQVAPSQSWRLLAAPIFLALFLIFFFIHSAQKQSENRPLEEIATFKEIRFQKCDELLLRYRGPTHGMCQVHLVASNSGHPIGSGTFSFDLANSKAITDTIREARVEIPVAITKKTEIAITGACQPFETSQEPNSAIDRLLKPIDEVDEKKLFSLLKYLFQRRNELHRQRTYIKENNYAWGNKYREVQQEFTKDAEKKIRVLLGSAFVDSYSQTLRKIDKKRTFAGTPFAERLERMLLFDNSVSERHNIILPWGYTNSLFNYEFGQVKSKDLLTEPKGSPLSEKWHKAFEIDFQERVGKFRRWLWMAPEKFVRKSRNSAAEAVLFAPLRDEGMLEDKGATFKDELTANPSDMQWTIRRNVEIKREEGKEWPPDEARLEFVTRLFAKDFFVRIRLGKRCLPITVINTSMVHTTHKIYSSSSAIYVSIPLDPMLLDEGANELTLTVEGPPYNVEIVNPMVFHCLRLFTRS